MFSPTVSCSGKPEDAFDFELVNHHNLHQNYSIIIILQGGILTQLGDLLSGMSFEHKNKFYFVKIGWVKQDYVELSKNVNFDDQTDFVVILTNSIAQWNFPSVPIITSKIM